MAVLVEAVKTLDSVKSMKKEIAAKNEMLKQKFLVDKSTRIHVESELTTILMQDLDEARQLASDQNQQILKLEDELFKLKQNLIEAQVAHRNCAEEKRILAEQLTDEKTARVKYESIAEVMKLQIKEIRYMEQEEMEMISRENTNLRTSLQQLQN